MKNKIETKGNGIEKQIIAVVRNQWDREDYRIFRGSGLQEIADQIEESKYNNEKAVSIDLFKSPDDIDPHLAELCCNVEVLGGLMNGACEPSNHTRHLGAILLDRLVRELMSLSEAVCTVDREIEKDTA